MFSNYYIDYKTILAGLMLVMLSLSAALAAIIFLLIFVRQASAQHPPYLLLAANIFEVISSFIMVASMHRIVSWSKVATVHTIFSNLCVLCSFQYLQNLTRNYYTSRFGTESRFIRTLYIVIKIFIVATLIAAVCSYSIQLYSGVNHLYPMKAILNWGSNVVQWCTPMMVIISKFSYRGLSPREETKKPKPNRLRIFGKIIVILTVCVTHGMVLLSYPPTNWKEMIGIVAVGFLIGIVYYQVAVPKRRSSCESIYDTLASEKPPLTNSED